MNESGLSSANKDKVTVPSPTELSWLLIRRDDELEEEEKSLVEALLKDAKLKEIRQLALEFIHRVRNRLSGCVVDRPAVHYERRLLSGSTLGCLCKSVPYTMFANSIRSVNVAT